MRIWLDLQSWKHWRSRDHNSYYYRIQPESQIHLSHSIYGSQNRNDPFPSGPSDAMFPGSFPCPCHRTQPVEVGHWSPELEWESRVSLFKNRPIPTVFTTNFGSKCLRLACRTYLNVFSSTGQEQESSVLPRSKIDAEFRIKIQLADREDNT